MISANCYSNFFLAYTLIMGVACTSPVEIVSASQQPGVDFESYQTFNFLDVSFRNDSAQDVSRQEVQQLKAAIAQELQTIGYRQDPDPDLWVNIGIMIEQREQTRHTDIREAPVYLGQRRYRWESEEIVVRRYQEGTVFVDLIDADQHERIWEGVARGMLSENPQKLEKKVEKAMQELFTKFPVRSVH